MTKAKPDINAMAAIIFDSSPVPGFWVVSSVEGVSVEGVEGSSVVASAFCRT